MSEVLRRRKDLDRPSLSIDDRRMREYLLANCVEEDGPLETKCVVFTGPRNSSGYGNVTYEGTTHQVHRIAWMISVGPIPPGRQINHLCNNPPCFRVSHLEVGTPSSNMQYMWDCGRHPGNRSHALPDEVILEARRMAGEGHDQTYIAECLGISNRTVSRLVRGVHRAELGGPITIIDRCKTSKFVGVSSCYGKWSAHLRIKGIGHHLGRFAFEGDAAICWNAHVAYLGLRRELNVITEADWHHD